MTYHSVVLCALSGLLSPATGTGEPQWLRDYHTAREKGVRQERPLAVFLGAGRSGWERVSESGRLPKEVRALLAGHYVCVYVDTEHIRGRELARAFEMPEGVGLVISDFRGKLQAFRHEGELPEEKLALYLRKYSDPERVVRFTEVNPDSRYVEESEVRPVRYVAPAPAPVFAPAFMGGGGGGC